MLGVLLIATATLNLAGWAKRWRPHGWTIWTLGLVSGFFGGVAGNRGGLQESTHRGADR